jgi:type II secretion system protein J
MRRGFTLLEMMVATVVLLLFLAGAYEAYATARMAMVKAEARQEVYQTARVLLAQMTAEVESAYQAPNATTSAVIGEDTEGTEAQADALTVLTTAHNAHGEMPVGDLMRVRYSMQDASANETPGLYIEEDGTPDLESADYTSERRLLSPRVTAFNCEYLAPGAEDWATSWLDQTALPASVRIALTVQGETPGSPPLVLTATVNLPLATQAEVTDEN